MKTINLQAVITSIRSRADGSIGLSMSSPELTPEEKTLFFQLQNINLKVSITPQDTNEAPEEHRVDADLNQKTQAQRIRAVLFLLWQKDNEDFSDFDIYYRNKTEKIINSLKARLDQDDS